MKVNKFLASYNHFSPFCGNIWISQLFNFQFESILIEICFPCEPKIELYTENNLEFDHKKHFI